MNPVIPFHFNGSDVRVVTVDGEPWFNAGDVCAALEFGNPRQAIESHVDDDDVQKLDAIDNLGRTQRANHVNEAGLYALVLGSTKQTAKRFKRWVTHEVLPTIRKTGGYQIPTAPRQPTKIEVGLLEGRFMQRGINNARPETALHVINSALCKPQITPIEEVLV